MRRRGGVSRAGLVLLLAGVTLTAGAATARAQDAHYWSQGYGARADLLGGVVVGSLLDLSNTYYNPGALSLLKDPSLILGTSAFQLLSLTVSGANFPDKKLETVSLRPLSGFFAAPVGKELAISYLNRFSAYYTLNSRVVTEGDFVPSIPGEELLVGEVTYQQALTESWGGLTWSRKVRDNVGVGVTGYGTLRNQSLRSDSFAQAVGMNDEAAALNRVVDYSFYTVGLLAKAGISVDNDPFTWGVTLTTPTLGLFGSGKAFGTESAIGVDLDGDGTPDTELIGLDEEGLTAKYHSPFSIAAGVEYKFSRSSVFLSAEWFNSVSSYEALELPSMVVSTTGDTLFLNGDTSAKAVFNAGIGGEYAFTDQFKMYGSFITDYSAATGNPEDLFTSSAWDLYHASLGSKFRVSSFSLILGLGYAFGSKTLQFDPIDADIPQPAPGKSDYRSLKAIVGIQAGI